MKTRIFFAVCLLIAASACESPPPYVIQCRVCQTQLEQAHLKLLKQNREIRKLNAKIDSLSALID